MTARVAMRGEATLDDGSMQAAVPCGKHFEQISRHWAESVWAFTIERRGEVIEVLRRRAAAAGITP